MSSSSSTLSSEHLIRLQSVQKSAGDLRQSSADVRNRILMKVDSLISQQKAMILRANEKDLQSLEGNPKSTSAFRDRLTLNENRLQQMQESLRFVASLPDPLGEVALQKTLPNGLMLKQVRSPLGVILMIFEARPNVITEAFSLAIKSGNALILRGGSESLETSRVLYSLVEEAIRSVGLPTELFWGVTDPSRDLSQALMTQNKYIDVLVPRGGDSLIHYVTQNATIPIIKNDRGLCHVYLHEDADPAMAIEIVLNSKTQRPGVCNSMETLLVHENRKNLLPRIYDRLQSFNVEWYGCPETVNILAGRPRIHPITSESFDTEYLDFKMNCRVVHNLNEALEHIEKHGSHHSECIITASEPAARKFQNSVDAAVAYWNASTRFTDGYQFGLGGELGISTQKLHVRGPVGLKELTSLRWIADGLGQIRE